MTPHTLKTIPNDLQQQIFNSYEANQELIKSKFSANYSISEIEIMDSREGDQLLMAYWVNFEAIVMPQTDVVIMTLGQGKKPEDFKTYMISQSELINVLGDEVTQQNDPLKLFAINKIDSSELINKITDVSIDLG